MLNLYPNPVKDNVMIDSEEAILEVSIFDVYGKVVTNLPVASQRQVQVKTENLPSGLYILRINLAGGEVIAHKFIKN
ncbi:MAG: T9SS type A sorting domain-containing protein [Bacteroidales bacterium]|nr:T9SS type A sorting domain-containing protein [Bacteroidales bacterium]